MGNIFAELRRRNIFRVAGIYAVVGWLLAQMSSIAFPAFGAPEWVLKSIIGLLLVGFPIALLLAWAFEMTPEGVKRTEDVEDGQSITTRTGRKLDFAILGALVLVAALVVGSRFIPQHTVTPEVIAQGVIPLTDAKPSIAVLPFADFSSTKDQEYFANGVSEELLNVLARIDGLRVSSRTSAFAFKEREASTGEIAEALNVGHILEGSVRKAGNTLRITAQLIDTKTDEHMWSQTYDRPLTAENIFAIQDEIAAAIVAELKGRLSVGETEATDRTANLEAYELYLRAREQMQKRLPETLSKAVRGYKHVIALDPEFAPAFAGLAVTYLLMSEYVGTDQDEAIALARPNVDRALELAPNSAEALTAAASLALDQNKLQEVLDFTKRAIAANPNYVLAYHRQGLAYGGLGQNEKALASFQKALELDPLSAVLLSNFGYYQESLGNLAGARATHEKNIKYNPTSTQGYRALGEIKYGSGDYAGAHTLFKDAQAINPESPNIRNRLLMIYMDIGLFDQALPLAKTPDDKGSLLVMRGDLDAAQKIVAKSPDETAFTAFLLGDTVAAYPELRQQATDINLVALPLTPFLADDMVLVATIFQANSDTDAKIIMDKLNTFFAGKTPIDFTSGDALLAAALLAIANGQPAKAFPWFERMADVRYAWAGIKNVNFPGMDGLRQYPKWLEIEKRFNENAAKQRAIIKAQLANPKPDWIKNE